MSTTATQSFEIGELDEHGNLIIDHNLFSHQHHHHHTLPLFSIAVEVDHSHCDGECTPSAHDMTLLVQQLEKFFERLGK